MTDEELQRHLARRADAGLGWPRQTIVSRVAIGIGDRPEPVRRRGVGPGSALAALASAIVLMVGVATIPTEQVSPAASDHSHTASPAQRPSNTPPAANIVECLHVAPTPGSVDGGDLRRVLLVVDDWTGLVERCTPVSGRDDIGGPAYSVANVGNDATKLLVSWHGTPCDRAATVRLAEEAGTYHVVIELRDGDCEAMLVSHGVTLDLAKPVPADRVAVRTTLAVQPSTTDTDAASSSVGRFALRLSAPRGAYLAGEPIEGITAVLTYEGSKQAIDVVGTGRLIYGFSTEMLDGPYATGVGVDEPCVRDHITRGEPIVQPYEKSGGFDPQGPHAAFYRDFFADPELRLPAGTWRITAYSEFYLGECGGETVSLDTSIEIDVLERFVATPTPVRTPDAGPQLLACGSVPAPPGSGPAPRPLGWRLAVDDPGGLVHRCFAGVEQHPPNLPIVLAPTDDAADGPGVAITWHGNPCREEVVIRLEPGRDSDAHRLDVAEIDTGRNCYGPLVGRSAVLFTGVALDLARMIASLNGVVEPRAAELNLPPEVHDCTQMSISLIDEAGLVEACVAWWPRGGGDVTPVANARADPAELELTWVVQDPALCAAPISHTLEIAPTVSAEVGDSGPVIIVPDEVFGGDGFCADDPTSARLAVRLTLARPVPAEHVVFLEDPDEREFRDETPTFHSVMAHSDAGVMRLSLRAGKPTYRAGERVDLEAQFSFDDYADRPVDSANLFGSFPRHGFVYEPLDDGQGGPSLIASCQRLEVQPGDTFVRRDDSEALTPGRWRISVSAWFSTESCAADPVRLDAYVIVTVK